MCPTLNLSIGNVNFSLAPSSPNLESSVLFQQDGLDYVINLKAFSGILRVSSSSSQDFDDSTPKANHTTKRKVSSSYNEPSKKIREALDKNDDDESAFGNNDNNEDHNNDDNRNGHSDEVLLEEVANAVSQTTRNNTLQRNDSLSQVSNDDPTIQLSQQPTLGQPDFSQLSQSSNYPHIEDDHETRDQETKEHQKDEKNEDDEREGNKVEEEITEDKTTDDTQVATNTEENNQNTDDRMDDDIHSRQSEAEDLSSEKKSVPRVSIGNSPNNNNQANNNHASSSTESNNNTAITTTVPSKMVHSPPCPRWGHTLTSIDQNRLIVYGGQTIDKETKKPKTLKDVHVYDCDKDKWFQPFNCEGMPRQWHTSTYLPERHLLISFGGETVRKGKTVTESTVMVLDTEIMLWYPPTVTGTIPSSRSGHTATVLGNDLVVFGGVRGSKWLNTLSVLDCTVWNWTAVKASGAAPPPRSYHSAVAVGTNRIVYFGGNNADKCFDTVHVLEKTNDNNWKWTHPTVKGTKPLARTGHTAVLVENKFVCVYGGWDPNADDEDDYNEASSTAGSNEDDLIFGDCFFLDTTTWTWCKRSDGFASGMERAGHDCVVSEENKVFSFGGRTFGDKLCNDLICLPL